MNLQDKRVLVYDAGGLFVSLALRLARLGAFASVDYFRDWQDGFCDGRELMVGSGLEEFGVHRVKWVWQEMDRYGLVIFPDCWHGDLQEFLRSKGKRVWGAGMRADLELSRWKTKGLIAQDGLPANKADQVTGVTALRVYLQQNPDVFVKVSAFRGIGETFESESYEHSKGQLDELEAKHGPMAEVLQFVIEKKIPDAKELGYDGYSINGEYPNTSLFGAEVKDKCFDDKTEILTKTGWKSFKETTHDDSFLTLDASDSKHYELEYQKPTHLTKADYTGKMLSIESTNVSLLVTPEHDLWIQRNVQNKTTGTVVTWTDFRGNNRTFHRGKHFMDFEQAKNINLSKPFQMPFPSSPTCKRITPLKFKICGEKITLPQYAVLMGLYLSEGHTRKRGNSYEVVIAQFKYVTAFAAVLKKLPFNFVRCKSGFRTCHRRLGEHLFQFGKSRDKYVPDSIKMASLGTIKEFLRYYCLGDGSFFRCTKQTRGKKTERIGKKYFTISKRMADDLQEMLAKSGSPSSIRYDPSNDRYIISERVINRKNYIFPHHCRWVDYSGKIYCVSVPNRLILVRRNGKVLWSGNSYFGKVVDYDKLPPSIREANTVLSYHMEGYRQFWSTELREKGGKGYVIDLTARHASPGGECIAHGLKNLPDILYYGADGTLVDAEWEEKFAAQIIFCSEWAEEHWQYVQFPEEIRDAVKLYNHCRIKNQDWVIPQLARMRQLGSVVALGNSPQEACEKAKDYARQVKGYDLEAETDALDKAMAEMAPNS